jgi:SAM-dependent methyltransferase
MSTIETIRQYWDRQPCCSRHSLNEPGSKEYFTDLTRKRYLVQPHIRDLASFPSWAGRKVLEIGCGVGTDAVEFVQHGAVYTGVDLSPESLKIAKSRFHVLGLEGGFFLGDAESLRTFLPESKYDLVYAFGSLHHTPSPAKALREAWHYMREGGELRMMVYAQHSWKSAMIDAGLDQFEAQDNCPLAYRYTPEQVERLLWEAGFGLRSLSQAHVFPYQVEPYKRGEYVLQPWFAAMPPEIFQALESHLGWHLLVTAIKTGEDAV